jgi:hypothetical protein
MKDKVDHINYQYKCILKGIRYTNIIKLCDYFLEKNSIELFNALNTLEYINNMNKWYYLLQNDDILQKNKYWVFGNSTLINKIGIYSNILHGNIYELKLLNLNLEDNIEWNSHVKVPAYILIPPRTDILII